MGSLRQQLFRAIPDWPRKRFNVFTGTNLWRDWFRAWKALLEIVRGKLAIAKPGYGDFDFADELKR